MPSPEILISAGDTSGDMYAAELARALSKRAGARLFGMGGPAMRAAGVELIADAKEIAVVGMTEVIGRLPAVMRAWRRLESEALRRRPALCVVVDSPGFNFHLARVLHRRGLRFIYFISPQLWAWRPGRVKWVRRDIEKMLVIFPFEEDFYRRAGIPVEFVGHPLVDLVRPRASRGEFCARHGLDAGRPIVTLLPGSRPSEVEHNLPGILEACRELHQLPAPQFVLAAAPGVSEACARKIRPGGLSVSLVEGETYDALSAAECAIISSGTATVEAALLGTPMVVVYRVSRGSAMMLRRMVRTPYISMVNLIAGEPVVPELIQDGFVPQRLAAEVSRLLASPDERERMRIRLRAVRERLGPGGAIGRAAESIARMLA